MELYKSAFTIAALSRSEQNPFHQTSKTGGARALATSAFRHSYDILGARMLWKPKEARILKNFIEF